jgi:hypothetical protein
MDPQKGEERNMGRYGLDEHDGEGRWRGRGSQADEEGRGGLHGYQGDGRNGEMPESSWNGQHAADYECHEARSRRIWNEHHAADYGRSGRNPGPSWYEDHGGDE